MKNLFGLSLIGTLIGAVSLSAQAAKYDCEFKGNGQLVAKFTLDTATEDNKFVPVDQNKSVGCVVFRSTPQLVNCGFGDATDQVFAAADDGSSIIQAYAKQKSTEATLVCLKAP